jgi:uncharacterized protein
VTTERGSWSLRARPRLIIMAKLARMGRVKTRLGRETGDVEATAFYRRNLFAVCMRLGRDPRWDTVLAVAPDISVAGPGWPGSGRTGFRRIAQGRGDLGQRMQTLIDGRSRSMCGGLRDGRSAGGSGWPQAHRGPVVIIGTDIPAVRPTHIAMAFQLLGRRPCVFGPAGDGGFWLVGQRRVPKILHVFADVRWSTEHALADCMLQIAPSHVALAAELPDVDTKSDLDVIASWFGRVILPASVSPTP